MAKKSRYWVKLDQNKRPIVGILENRPTKPKGGEWMEIAGTPCCNVSVELCDTAGHTGITLIISDAGQIIASYDFDSTDPDDVVDDFNTDFPGAGVLSYDADANTFLLKTTLGANITMDVECTGTTTTSTTTTTTAP